MSLKTGLFNHISLWVWFACPMDIGACVTWFLVNFFIVLHFFSLIFLHLASGPVKNIFTFFFYFNLMARCRVIRLSAEETMPSTPSSVKLVPKSTFLVPLPTFFFFFFLNRFYFLLINLINYEKKKKKKKERLNGTN